MGLQTTWAVGEADTGLIDVTTWLSGGHSEPQETFSGEATAPTSPVSCPEVGHVLMSTLQDQG
jgi:hypothetical protein